VFSSKDPVTGAAIKIEGPFKPCRNVLCTLRCSGKVNGVVRDDICADMKDYIPAHNPPAIFVPANFPCAIGNITKGVCNAQGACDLRGRTDPVSLNDNCLAQFGILNKKITTPQGASVEGPYTGCQPPAGEDPCATYCAGFFAGTKNPSGCVKTGTTAINLAVCKLSDGSAGVCKTGACVAA
jgi:hypothetical protein